MVEQKGFAIQRPWPAAESESRTMFDWKGEMVEQKGFAIRRPWPAGGSESRTMFD